MSTRDFAERAGVTQQAVANYLSGWGRAIEAEAPVTAGDRSGCAGSPGLA